MSFLASRRAALSACLALACSAAWSQLAPGGHVTLVVPYPAGGPSDAIGRVMSGSLGRELGHTVIVSNIAGASGTLGAQQVLRAPADGRHILQGSPNEVILAPLAIAAARLRAEDFRLVHPVADAVMVVATRADLGVRSVDDLVALARRSADRPLTYGSVGIGSLNHFVAEDVQRRTGIRLQHVPYRGNAPLITDLAGGQVDFAVLVYSAALGGMAEQGRLRVIAQLGAQRSELLRNVPTVAEGQSLPNFSYRTWTGFMVPVATPEAVVQQLHSAIGRTLKDPDVRARLAAQTQLEAAPMSLAEAGRFFESEMARYRALATAIGLQPQ